MKIDFGRTGGLAGLRLSVAFDTNSLTSEQAAEIEKLVVSSRFYELPPGTKQEASTPDRFEYRVRISSPARGAHAIVVGETTVPDGLRPLLDYLTALAMRGHGKS